MYSCIIAVHSTTLLDDARRRWAATHRRQISLFRLPLLPRRRDARLYISLDPNALSSLSEVLPTGDLASFTLFIFDEGDLFATLTEFMARTTLNRIAVVDLTGLYSSIVKALVRAKCSEAAEFRNALIDWANEKGGHIYAEHSET